MLKEGMTWNLQVIWMANLRDRIDVMMAEYEAKKKGLDKLVEECVK